MERYNDYIGLLRSLRSMLPQDWIDLFLKYSLLDLTQRKAGITLFRARSMPLRTGSTYEMKTKPFLQALLRLGIREKDLMETLESILCSADTSSFSLSLLLSAPYTAETVHQIFSEMVVKELSVMESTPKQSSICWDHLFTYDQPLHPDFRRSSNTNATFRIMFSKWVAHIKDHVIYPFSSTKSLSRSTTREFNRLSGNDFDEVSPLQLEQYYAETGVEIHSPCEMRQVWYPTNATPRTYYAMGGTAYFKSRYLRDVFNVFADLFPSTNRYTRVLPSHLTFSQSSESVYIYDLTSFTSLFHEQRYFLDFIANCLSGVEVVIFNTHTGFQNVLISDLISDYNDLNKEPEYSMERIWDFDIVLHHSVAGFLGVYGNLITCTIPHGLCLMTMRSEGLKSWCAGDDAGSIGISEDLLHLHDLGNMSNSIGVLQTEKVYSGDDILVALKRRLLVLPMSLHLQVNVLFPPFSIFFKNDPRFSRNSEDSYDDRVATFCSGVMSMLYQLSISDVGVEDVSFLKDILPFIYQQLRIPPEGFFPPLCGHTARFGASTLNFSVPRILGDFWKVDPNKALLDAFMPSMFDGYLTGHSPWDGSIVDEWTSNGDKLLSMCVRMGYLSRREARVTYTYFEDIRDAVYREYLREFDRSPVLFIFNVIDKVPAFYELA